MKYVVFLGMLIVFIVGHSLAADYLDSHEVIPEYPATGESFIVRLNGTWPNACTTIDRINTDYSSVSQKIYIYIYVTPPSGECAQVMTPWSNDVTIPATEEKGLYEVSYRFFCSDDAYGTSYITAGYIPIGLPDIKKCEVEGMYDLLSTSGGFSGYGFGSFHVSGSFTFIDNGDGGWLTDVELHAHDSQNRVGDIAELFGLGPAPIYLDNNTYKNYFAGHERSSLTIEEPGADQIILTGTYHESGYDTYQYDLTCYATVIDHSICKKFPAGDANKDCKIDLQDLALMAFEWLDCQLLDQADCTQ